ncbi:hypothetical protein SARC_09014 [Sphaeroforma arctica JP610]|uniref:ABC transmembrane type-1 domain-containing protein n=1 Tax=Sphaeroforma arctica JP610 TaxID=667725 RepID=A0A0L0FP62_9EUKA|nr:hypothetical protein SARC_09014 [Sphaeroforma arctica JP610]KNC78567.1 hypothetical protein SARC_09014 [Sphaeroforma arctica JP610]|eukprot:XP_014152469.1 hypothetical protein SARC_09014 [Sphaeroforma arctica JP610]
MRGQIGYVGQEPVLFAGTIAENIAMGAALVPNPDFDQDYPHDVFHNRRFLTQEVTQNDIERACEMANAHDFICHMPDGYQTQIGEGGGMLSGGQKQRIAIARALIRDPKILLLDEATSALDVKSEAVVQAALDKASRGRTTIIIAHRLTTVRKANTIVFLDQGQILESGSHAELMAKGGEYADFVKLQEGDAPNKRKPSIISETSFTSLTDDTQTAITIVEATISREEERAALELVKNEDEIMLKKLNRTTKKTPEEKDAEKHFFKVIMIQRPEWWLLFVGFVCAIISGAMWPMFAFAFGEMLWVFITVDTERSMFYVWLFFLIGCIAFASNFFMHTANGYVAEKLTRRLREKTFRSLMRQDIGFFDQEEHSVGALSVNLSTDAANVSNLTGGVIIAQTMMFTTVLTSVAIGFASCAQLAAVMFATIPATGLAAYLGIRLSRTVEAKALLSMDNANTIAGEFLASVRTVTYLGVSENVCLY